jgi:hypothetical protein
MTARSGALALVLLLAVGRGQAGLAQPRSDEESLAVLLHQAARETATHVPRGDTELRILPDDIHPMAMQVFAEELTAHNIGVRARSPQASSRLTVEVRAMNSSTSPITNSSYLRTLTLSIGILIEDRVAGSVAWSKTLDFRQTDTLAGVPACEQRDFRGGDDSSWMESILVPALSAAAALVIVVLLFTVRGS